MKLLFDYKMLGEVYSSEYEIDPTAVAIYPKDKPNEALVYFYVDEYVAYARALIGANEKFGIDAVRKDIDEYAKEQLDMYKYSNIKPRDRDYTLEYLTSLPLDKIKKYLKDAGFVIRVKKTGFKVGTSDD